MDHMDLAKHLADEFAIGSWVDEERESIFVKISQEWFIPLLKRMRTECFDLVFKSEQDNIITCVFIYDKYGSDLNYAFDEDLDDEY